MVTDADASRMLVDSFGVMPYKQSAESTNPFLKNANEYAAEGNYVMPWVTNFQPNVDAYREALVAAMNQYDADQTDANWELVEDRVRRRLGSTVSGSQRLISWRIFCPNAAV